VTLTIDAHHGSPIHLVNRAIVAQRAERQEYRRGRGIPYDEIWCVFDDDHRPEVREAITRAERWGVGVAFSNPCIELWFVLHFDHHGAWVTNDQIQRRASQLLGCDKNLTDAALDLLCERYEPARERAKAIAEGHVTAGASPYLNPSSTLWHLIESMHGR
jgi:hypothetical protein